MNLCRAPPIIPRNIILLSAAFTTGSRLPFALAILLSEELRRFSDYLEWRRSILNFMSCPRCARETTKIQAYDFAKPKPFVCESAMYNASSAVCTSDKSAPRCYTNSSGYARNMFIILVKKKIYLYYINLK